MVKHQKPKPPRIKPKPAPVSDEVLQSMIRPKSAPPVSGPSPYRPPAKRSNAGIYIAVLMVLCGMIALWAFVH